MAIKHPTFKLDGTSLLIRRIVTVAVTLVLVAFTLMVIIPFIWMIVMSLRTTGGILNDPYGLPWPIRWQNYWKLFTDPDIKFYRYYFNSTFVTGFALILNTIVATMGGYAFGRKRFDFKGRSLLLGALLIAVMVPVQILYIPQFMMVAKYGLLNTRWVLVFLYAALSLPVSIYLLSSYFSQLPSEFEDAARIDGCTEFGIFWRVMLPLARPALATVILINFMNYWNELMLAITMVPQAQYRTLPAALLNFVGEHGSDYAIAAASLVSTAAPIFILYLFMSERFVEGIMAGGVKG
jgi:raffinose/stachyose/melibiose transport system permease protein